MDSRSSGLLNRMDENSRREGAPPPPSAKLTGSNLGSRRRPGMLLQRDGDLAQSDICYGLGSPHLHHLLRRDRGWSVAAYRAWLERILIQQLLR